MIIVLVMHGMAPKDFPIADRREFIRLHAQIEDATGGPHKVRHDMLARKLRDWPRNEKNDPFHASSLRIGEALSKETGLPVLVAFNEFCAPDVPGALDQAAASADDIFIVCPMMVRGGNHAEEQIPDLVEDARLRHPSKRFHYAWPYAETDIARFLAAHLRHYQDKAEKPEG